MKLIAPSILLISLVAGGAWAQSAAGSSAATASSAPTASMSASGTPATAGTPSVTLQECLDQALANGPDLKSAKLTLSTSAAQLAEAHGKNGFSLSANGAYSYAGEINTDVPTSVTTATDQSVSTPGNGLAGTVALSSPNTSVSVTASHSIPTTSGTDQTSTLSVSATQKLYDGYPGGRARAAVQEAEYAYQVALLTYNQAQTNEIYNVEQDYYTLLGDQRTVGTQEANVAIGKQDLARAKAYYTAGNASSLDVLQSQIAERQDELNLSQAQDAVTSARETLSALIGWAVGKVYTVADTSTPAVPKISTDNAVQTALSNRIELKQIALDRS
jgi:outer membrane protein